MNAEAICCGYIFMLWYRKYISGWIFNPWVYITKLVIDSEGSFSVLHQPSSETDSWVLVWNKMCSVFLYIHNTLLIYVYCFTFVSCVYCKLVDQNNSERCCMAIYLTCNKILIFEDCIQHSSNKKIQLYFSA